MHSFFCLSLPSHACFMFSMRHIYRCSFLSLLAIKLFSAQHETLPPLATDSVCVCVCVCACVCVLLLRSTGETARCVLLVVGAGLSSHAQQTPLDQQGLH